MSIEAVFILTYIGIIVAVAALSCLIYWLWEGRKKPLSWKRLRAEVAMVVHILLQVALLWFAALGMAGAILVVYRVFVQPAELGIQAAVIAYVIGIISAIGMWTAVWRREVDNGCKPNAFLAKQDQIKQECFVAGCDITAQQMFDMMCIVLHDPKIMGTHAVPAEKLRKIHQAMYDLEAEFHSAWVHNQESDYYQEKLDDALREIFGEIDPFKKRYPLCKEWDYNKPMKKG